MKLAEVNSFAFSIIHLLHVNKCYKDRIEGGNNSTHSIDGRFPAYFLRKAPHESRMINSVSIMERRAGFKPFSIKSIKISTACIPN